MSLTLKNSSIITALSLATFPAHKKEIYLGNTATNSFVITNDYWQTLATILKQPSTISQIAQKMSQTYPHNFPPRVAIFRVKIMILELLKHGLIEKIDGQVFTRPENPNHQSPQSFIPINLLFAKPLLVIYAGLGLLALVGPWFGSNFQPNYNDFFWHQRLSYSLATFFLLSWILGLSHEYAHYLTAKHFKITSQLSLSNRLMFLTLQTEYQNLHQVKSWQRVLIYAAGIISDLLVIGLLNGIIIINGVTPLIKQALLIEWLGISWQFLFFMRTDIYFIVRELTGVDNLFIHSKNYLRHLFTHTTPPTHTSSQQKIIVSSYAVFMLIGTAIAIARYSLYHFPIVIKTVLFAFETVKLGIANTNRDQVIDGLIILAIEIISSTLYGYIALKKHRPNS